MGAKRSKSRQPSKPSVQRCPACGEPLKTIPEDGLCPLCEARVADVEASPVGDDITPFSKAAQRNMKSWWGMCKWIYTAGSQRLAHLSLMKASPASRGFAKRSLLLFALAGALLSFSRDGWFVVTQNPLVPSLSTKAPDTVGWLQVAVSGRIEHLLPIPIPTEIWWSPLISLIGVVLTFAGGLIAGRLIYVLGKALIEFGFHEKFRRQKRMSAALQYSFAWLVPLVAAAVLENLYIIGRFSDVGRWPVQIAVSVHLIPDVLLAAFGVFTWWFMLVRLANATPVKTRSRLTAHMGVYVPLLGIVITVGWLVGTHYGLIFLVNQLGLGWS